MPAVQLNHDVLESTEMYDWALHDDSRASIHGEQQVLGQGLGWWANRE
jgi:hypothetical protein